jgi:hypothetical protein
MDILVNPNRSDLLREDRMVTIMGPHQRHHPDLLPCQGGAVPVEEEKEEEEEEGVDHRDRRRSDPIQRGPLHQKR